MSTELKESESAKLRLAEEEIARLRHLLEESEKRLHHFTYLVSHDLRAPLRHISSYGAYLNQGLSGRLDEREQKFMDNILGSAEKMNNLVESLVYNTRLGAKGLNIQDVDAAELVASIKEEMLAINSARNISFNIGPLPTVCADAALLGQVFTHLISNALKFSEPKPESSVHISYTDNEENHLFSVKDNGVGFDMRFADKLFGIFQRLHLQTEFSGLGIGLANSKRIVEKHQGTMWAESVLGEGATFYFTIFKDLRNVA